MYFIVSQKKSLAVILLWVFLRKLWCDFQVALYNSGNYEIQWMSCLSITGHFQVASRTAVNALVAYWQVTDKRGQSWHWLNIELRSRRTIWVVCMFARFGVFALRGKTMDLAGAKQSGADRVQRPIAKYRCFSDVFTSKGNKEFKRSPDKAFDGGKW